jgi:hypothetical protein
MCNDSARKFRTSKLIRFSNLLVELIQSIVLTKEVLDQFLVLYDTKLIINEYRLVIFFIILWSLRFLAKNISTPLLRMKKRLVKDLHF